MSEPQQPDDAPEKADEAKAPAGEYPVNPPARRGARWFSFRPPILEYLRPMDKPRPGIQLALGFGGFCAFYGLMMTGYWFESLTVGLGLIVVGMIMLCVLAKLGAKEPLIGYVIALGLSPLACCGLCSFAVG